jgi:hypothetical protein
MISTIRTTPASSTNTSALRFPASGGTTSPDPLGPLPVSTAELSFGNTNAVNQHNASKLAPNQVSFGSTPGQSGGADRTINELKSTFVRGGRVGISKVNALDAKMDQILKNPTLRSALIDRYNLNSADNRKALMAVGTMESGGNGDMGETMTATMNRALMQNVTREITGKGGSISIKDVVNQKNQYESASRVNAVINGGRTHQNWNAYKGEAGQVADAIFRGQSTFKQDASDIYFFRAQSFGRSTEFKIGKHNFDDTLNGQTYTQEALRLAGRINHTR